MSKIEEALEKASRLRKAARHPDTAELQKFNATGITRPVDNHLVTVHDQGSPVSEEYRRLKSMVIRETKADFQNTIMVTSAIDTEGKTLTSINLAIAMAQELDHSILLMDADMRRPMTHRLLGLECNLGLSDYLRGKADVSEILVRTGIGKLVLLPAGSPVINPVELLSSVRMRELVQELKHRYMDRYIIIDTPPILPFADAIAVGANVDGVIFVVQEERAQKSSIVEAIGMLKNVRVLGLVYNKVSPVNLDGHYSRYYRYGYKYREREKS
jgi:exopolysaccharide/PEP-CTERM locus tyrosine autokinase